MRDAPLEVCPRCGKPGLKRLIGRGAGIIFKGSGFYQTDYKRAAEPAGEAGAKAGEGGAKDKPAAETSSAPAKPPAAGAGNAPTPPKT